MQAVSRPSLTLGTASSTMSLFRTAGHHIQAARDGIMGGSYSSSPAAASASARLVNTRPDTTWPPFTAQIHCVGESEI